MLNARPVMRALVGILVLGASGCGITFWPLPPGSVTGRNAVYDYSPTALQSGNVRQLWWCGWDDNASDRTQISDSIEYESINVATGAHSPPKPVFGETQYAWDGAYTCNPKVIRGTFVNPLGNGETYTYALYYVATGAVVDVPNKIGVAFSNNGTDWKKYPQPIIYPVTQNGYGVGQPAVHNDDHQSAIRMFYEDWEAAPVYHVEAISKDGVHFQVLGRLTTKGLDPNNPSPSWGDMDYDPVTGYWYAAFNLQNRPPASTGGVQELGQYGIQVYRIPDASLLTGATPWELVMTIDTCLTGFESNFLPGFVRDPYGNLNFGSYPALQLYTSISNPPPAWNATPYEAQFSATLGRWDISLVTVEPIPLPPKALNRYFNQTVHEVTTGWIDPNGGFTLEKTLGHLYENPQQGATLQFFSCKAGSTGYFVSLDSTCGGALVMGSEGYGYSKPVAGLNLVPLYSCSTGTDDFVSNDAGCEGKAAGEFLGYALP
jgi:hypothetical protein